MGNKELRNSCKKEPYFKKPILTKEDNIGEAKQDDEGTRDMYPLAPFIISGGRNTERYYFIHINDLTDTYKFNIRPKYFGDESAYTDVFPRRIKEILDKNEDAKIFCVFDMDTIYEYELLEKHKIFEESLKNEINKGQVIICESMPSFEYWLLLHFIDYKGPLKNYTEVSNLLAPYIKPYFINSSLNLKKLLKSEKYLKDSTWIRKILEEGLLQLAIDRAQNRDNLEVETTTPINSYTNVYKICI